MGEMRTSFREEETARCGVLASLCLKPEFHRYNGRPLARHVLQDPETGNSQDAGNASLLQGRRDTKLRCACQPLFEARMLLIQRETSSSAQQPKLQVRRP